MTTDRQTILIEALDANARGERDIARNSLRELIQDQPSFAEAWYLLGSLAYEDGDRQSAFSYLRMAVELDPRQPKFLSLLAMIHRDSGKLDEAEATLRRALQIDPVHEAALRNLGLVLVDQHRIDEASEVLSLAVQLGHDHHITHNVLGITHDLRGRWDEAEHSYRRAIELNPHDANAATNLGSLLGRLGRIDEALEISQRATELQPKFFKAWSNLGSVLGKAGRWDEAIAHHQRAIELNSQIAGSWNNLGLALKEIGRIQEASAAFRQSLALEARPSTHSNLLLTLVYDPTITPQTLAEEHRLWGQRFGQTSPIVAPYQNLREANRRLRVGYVSPDFRSHAVARFIEPILAHHNPEQFEVYCYSNVPMADATTKHLQTLVTNWRSIYGIEDSVVAARIREDQIDILIDLAGHTALNRLQLFALRPAPIQATYLGYPATTGLSAIDYRFTDVVQDPPDEPHFDSETLVHLPMGSSCFQPAEPTPSVAISPAELTGVITFGSPHNLAKLNDDVFDTWATILREQPNSRLLFFRGGLEGESAARLKDEFARRGIEPYRIATRSVSSTSQGYSAYMAIYHEVDICLDAFPANAGTTACESLWMGVPWVALRGNRFYSRQTASVLTRVGLADWIANDRSEYVKIALAKSADIQSLIELRTDLRPRFLQSPIGNPAQYTAGLEATLRELWIRYLAT